MGKLCGDCRRNLMVVLHKLKVLNGGVISRPLPFFCKKGLETGRDKVEYLQNLKTFMTNYKCTRFLF